MGKFTGLIRRATGLAMSLLLVGCHRGESKPGVRLQPLISAEPNPVPLGGAPGVTTIHWDTADGSIGEVYIAVDNGEERLFARGSSGTKVADWISAGSVFEFRLYPESERTNLLATVKVTRASR